MRLSPLSRQKLLLSPRLPALTGRQLTYVDIGARGDLDQPWSLMPKGALDVVGFEPDPQACTELNQNAPGGWRYIPAALWSNESKVTFHINHHPSTSSVYPSNLDRIRRYGREHWENRDTARVVEVDARTLDSVAAEFSINADMIKVDTQGCELAILSGAARTLNSAVAVLLETWTTEVYRGQGLTGEILTLMQASGYSLYDVNVAAAWKRQRASDKGLFAKRQIIGLDLLFIKDDAAALCQTGKPDKAIMAAAIADMFGFPDAALDILEGAQAFCPDKASLNEAAGVIEKIARRSNTLSQKVRRRLIRWLGIPESPFPSLHY